jgi:hypothetical protein
LGDRAIKVGDWVRVLSGFHIGRRARVSSVTPTMIVAKVPGYAGDQSFEPGQVRFTPARGTPARTALKLGDK